jgi:hypothetical protein
MKRFIITLIVATLIIAACAAVPATASAEVVQRDSRTYAEVPAVCSCVATIDGYVFTGMPYSPFVAHLFGYDDNATAADLWSDLASKPGYVSNPPVTSISTATTVSGTVEDDSEG